MHVGDDVHPLLAIPGHMFRGIVQIPVVVTAGRRLDALPLDQVADGVGAKRAVLSPCRRRASGADAEAYRGNSPPTMAKSLECVLMALIIRAANRRVPSLDIVHTEARS